jgi:hypothetical protein
MIFKFQILTSHLTPRLVFAERVGEVVKQLISKEIDANTFIPANSLVKGIYIKNYHRRGKN